jgi:hypothetical protein
MPNRYDFEQADINGIRFVMPDMIAVGLTAEWIATVYSNARANAYIFGSDGNLSYGGRTLAYTTRCVGR